MTNAARIIALVLALTVATTSNAARPVITRNQTMSAQR